MTIETYKTLYNIDSKGKIRIWYMERVDNKYRTVSGLEDGEHVISGWKDVYGKNVGKTNATTDSQQADLEVKSLYSKKIDNKYFESKEDVGRSKFFKPMLASKWDDYKNKIPVGALFYSQPKLDGYRCLASKDGLMSRGGKPFVSCPHIIDALADIFSRYQDIVFDGELYNHKFKNDFNELGSIIKQMKPTQDDFAKAKKLAQYHIYDLPSCNDTFDKRFVELINLIGADPYIKLVWTEACNTEEDLDWRYGQYLEEGYEGQMIRLNNELYESGKRSKSLMKRKEFFDAEFDVVSLEEGQGNWAGCAKAVYFKMPNGELTKGGENPRAGIKGSMEFAKALLNGPMPRYVTVRYPNLTPDGVPRFPIAVEFFNEKRDV